MQKLFLQERSDRATPPPRRCSPRTSASKYGDRREEDLALVPSNLTDRFNSEDDGDCDDEDFCFLVCHGCGSDYQTEFLGLKWCHKCRLDARSLWRMCTSEHSKTQMRKEMVHSPETFRRKLRNCEKGPSGKRNPAQRAMQKLELREVEENENYDDEGVIETDRLVTKRTYIPLYMEKYEGATPEEAAENFAKDLDDSDSDHNNRKGECRVRWEEDEGRIEHRKGNKTTTTLRSSREICKDDAACMISQRARRARSRGRSRSPRRGCGSARGSADVVYLLYYMEGYGQACKTMYVWLYSSQWLGIVGLNGFPKCLMAISD